MAVTECISPEKDADGFHSCNFGRLAEGHPAIVSPCTPLGCMELLRRSDVPLRGSRAVVIGRSAIVGRPLALMLTNADSTVTICHSRTRELPAICREADILVAAIGRPRHGRRVVRQARGIRDRRRYDAAGWHRGRRRRSRRRSSPIAGWLTPVPGGVGPMTVAMLLRNTVALARARRGLSRAESMPSMRVRWSESEARKPYARPFMVTFSGDDGSRRRERRAQRRRAPVLHAVPDRGALAGR